jgi:hypothetical protein
VKADATVQLVETYDELKMLSAKSVTKDQQDLVDQVFSQMSNEKTEESIAKLNAKSGTSTIFIIRSRNISSINVKLFYSIGKDNAWIGGSKEAYEASKKAALALAAYQKIVNKEQVTALRYSSSYAKLPYPYCQDLSNHNNTCDQCSTLFRSADGSCNNLNFPWWGKSETPDKRLLPSAYDDYVTEPRVRSIQPGKYLPNARKVAMSVFQPQPTVPLNDLLRSIR